MSHDPHEGTGGVEKRAFLDHVNDELRTMQQMHGAPCPHRWRYIDEHDLFYCLLCKRTESPDDDPKDAA